MKEYLKRYADQNPERFNKQFILSRNSHDILAYVKDIFKSLEILDEIKVEDITLNKDESTFGPIKSQGRYYKSILPSRLDKIHYRVRITPKENITPEEIDLSGITTKEKIATESSFIKEGDIFINKLIDDCFYINEGIRYFLIYQIVDNATYGVDDAVTLKSLLMPITVKQHIITVTPEYFEKSFDLKSFDVLLFAKMLSPVMYCFLKDSYNSLVKYEVQNPEEQYQEWVAYRDPSLIDKFNTFFKVNFKFSDKLVDLTDSTRYIFRVASEKDSNEGLFVSVPKKDLEKDSLTQGVLGSLLDMKNETKKKRISLTYDKLISPWFWINTAAVFFTRNNDYTKKFNKIRTVLISLSRLMDDTTRKILNIKSEDKENALTVIRYIMENFETLRTADSQDLSSKRLRLYEYQLYPLRKYFSEQVYRVLNSPTRSKAVLDRVFSGVSPMYVIKQTVTSELLRYYNSSNEMNLFSAFLKYTFRGPQSLSKSVTMEQRDIHPSYAGRLSLIASSASDPGMSGTLTPFIEEYDYYFEKQDTE